MMTIRYEPRPDRRLPGAIENGDGHSPSCNVIETSMGALDDFHSLSRLKQCSVFHIVLPIVRLCLRSSYPSQEPSRSLARLFVIARMKTTADIASKTS